MFGSHLADGRLPVRLAAMPQPSSIGCCSHSRQGAAGWCLTLWLHSHELKTCLEPHFLGSGKRGCRVQGLGFRVPCTTLLQVVEGCPGPGTENSHRAMWLGPTRCCLVQAESGSHNSSAAPSRGAARFSITAGVLSSSLEVACTCHMMFVAGIFRFDL